MSSLFGSLETTKLDKVDVVDPSTATEDGKAADAKSTYKELTRISGMAYDARVLAESKADKATTLAGYGITDAATKLELNSKADLVGGKIPSAQLPSFVDDVLEYDSMSDFPVTSESGKIYVAKDTNLTYRWSGTQYVEISPSIALGETASTAYPGDKGKVAAENAIDASKVATEAVNIIGAHKEDKSNPHAVTAAQVGAVPLVEDEKGNKTAVTIGSRVSGVPVGEGSLANGYGLIAFGTGSHAEGINTVASGEYSNTYGVNTFAQADYSYAGGVHAGTKIGDDYAFAWNGDSTKDYTSNGQGTFNINPKGGLNGFYIGNQTLYAILTNKSDKATPSSAGNLATLTADGNLADSGKTVGDFLPRVSNGPVYSTFDVHSPLYMDMDGYIRLGVAGFIYGPFDQIREGSGSPISLRTELDSKAERSMISATDPTFSNAVLAVGLNIDTNSVAVLNEIAKTFGGFPLGAGETATTVGGLLAALAAAAAWLKKNKVQTLKLNDNSVETSADGGVAKLDDFFTESNSLLTGTIEARLPYPLNSVADETGLLKDRSINTTSLASVTVPDDFTDLLIRASVASSLSVTMPEAITTKYGDTFPGEAGEYLITITKTGAAEAYVRTIKLEVANA